MAQQGATLQNYNNELVKCALRHALQPRAPIALDKPRATAYQPGCCARLAFDGGRALSEVSPWCARAAAMPTCPLQALRICARSARR